ncbi:hypothetical protein [Streptomyces sp. NRRL S-1813]|uniref:hypothetical protein n=1 Tax=Streptomyces sp. NRRL S-1813 TaxID=1463888 RepID=UPI000B256949
MVHDNTGIKGERAADGPRSAEELRRATAAGKRVRFVHFWGHSPRRDGSLGPSCFSQWWPSPFTVDGVRYATAEHWKMAGKPQTLREGAGPRA